MFELETLRRLGFTIFDMVNGNVIGKHISDIRNYYRLDQNQRENIDTKKLKQLLDHAVKTTPFYKHITGYRGLRDFPVISKGLVKSRYKDFFSVVYDKNKLIPVTTSGSYGTPFTFYLTRDKKYRQQAEIIYFGEWVGYSIGKKHAYIRVTATKSRLKLFLQNEYLLNPKHIDTGWLEKQRRLLKNKNIELVIGYPSAMNAISSYCKEQGDTPEDFSLRSFISTAEPLTREVRNDISRIFGCTVLNRYSTEEFGVLAMECKQGGNNHMNSSGFVIELLSQNDDSPVASETPGRVVVTDLYSYAMPLIRFDTGDIAVMSQECTCDLPGHVLTSIEGRRIESVYTPAGTRISPFAINGAMRDLKEVRQFQFIQTMKSEYELKIVATEEYDSRSEDIIRARMNSILGIDGNLNILYVDDIAPLESGKRPYILNKSR
jgi:phenylacetate-CoA ligase